MQAEGGILLGLQTAEANTQAEQLFQRVVAFYQGKKNKESEASTLSAAANLYADADQMEEAGNYFERVRAIYVAGKNTYQLVSLIKRLGDLEVEQNPETTVVDYYLSEAESADEAGDPLSLGAALEAAAAFHRDKKENQKAIEYYERALAAYHAVRLTSQEINIIRSMAGAYQDMGNKAKADELRKQADELSKLAR